MNLHHTQGDSARGIDRHGELKALIDDWATLDALRLVTDARAEAGDAPLKKIQVLGRVRVDPWRIGAMTAAALVLLHLLYARST